jgi:hypothetical protein
MATAVVESFADLHKERIYRELENEIKRSAPDLKLVFDALVDWKWVGGKYCFFFYPGTFFAHFCASPDKPLPVFIREFGMRHGIEMELKTIDPNRYEEGSLFRVKDAS